MPPQPPPSSDPAAGLHVDQRGDGEPLLLLHGFTGSHADWFHLFPEPPRGFRCIAPDLPGHGRSASPFVSFRKSAERVAAVLEALGVRRFRAIGLSGGAQALLHQATALPQAVESMVLVSTAPYFPSRARELMGLMDPEDRGEAEWTTMRGRHHLGDDQIRALWRAGHDLKDSYDDVNFTPPSLARIRARTLVVHGDRDPLYDVEQALALHTGIAESHLWILPNGGHLPIFGDDSAEFVRRSLAFLRGEWTQ
ncbi:MAG: alpha/beta hydrolase [Acidobacteriota bacterium]